MTSSTHVLDTQASSADKISHRQPTYAFISTISLRHNQTCLPCLKQVITMYMSKQVITFGWMKLWYSSEAIWFWKFHAVEVKLRNLVLIWSEILFSVWAFLKLHRFETFRCAKNFLFHRFAKFSHYIFTGRDLILNQIFLIYNCLVFTCYATLHNFP